MTTAILRLRSRPGWQQQAACVGNDPEVWFPDPADHETTSRAYATCVVCPVVRACLAAALVDHEHGIWGGTTDTDRADARADLTAGSPVDQVLNHYTDPEPVEWRQTA